MISSRDFFLGYQGAPKHDLKPQPVLYNQAILCSLPHKYLMWYSAFMIELLLGISSKQSGNLDTTNLKAISFPTFTKKINWV